MWYVGHGCDVLDVFRFLKKVVDKGEIRVCLETKNYSMTTLKSGLPEFKRTMKIKRLQCNTVLLLNVNTTALGMFCGAKYTHHSVFFFKSIKKIEQLVFTISTFCPKRKI